MAVTSAVQALSNQTNSPLIMTQKQASFSGTVFGLSVTPFEDFNPETVF